MTDPDSPGGVSRRAVLGWLAAAGVGAGAAAAGLELSKPQAAGGEGAQSAAADAEEPDAVPFFGPVQSGIVTAPPAALAFAAFDLTTESATDVKELLRSWTEAGARLTAGEPLAGPLTNPHRPPADNGEALGLGPSRLTLTVGFGPSMFERDGRPRFGLRRPEPLRVLPPFPTDRLDPSLSGGDVCVQSCAEDPVVAFHAVHELHRLGRGVATLRWLQRGFGRASAVGPGQSSPRNLMGFRDGTDNIRSDDGTALRQHVWVGPEGPAWLRGGTYAVVRRIRMHLERWDGADLGEQQDTIGRFKGSGAPFTGHREFDPVNLEATDPNGLPVIPMDSHIRLAAPATNGGARLLRRGYSYAGGVDSLGNLDAGLFFVAFQRDPFRHFVPIQRRLAAHDHLNEYIAHTSSAVFAIPPGVPAGGSLGRGLL